ncbi:MAG: macro domain-containing protein [Bacteroidota bacterium]
MVRLCTGTLFRSEAQVVVNAVNCVGVMSKGLALMFKRQYPAMYNDYVERCDQGRVQVGVPYIFDITTDRRVINLPLKYHWLSPMTLDAIRGGLDAIYRQHNVWEITSLAVPPLGSTDGHPWQVIGPLLYDGLSRFDCPTELYAPLGVPDEHITPQYLAAQAALANASASQG